MRLYATEKVQINGLHSFNLFFLEIARQLGRNRSAMMLFFGKRKAQKEANIAASNQKLTNQDQRLIVFAAIRQKPKKTAKENRDSLRLNVSVRRVQQLLSQTEFL